MNSVVVKMVLWTINCILCLEGIIIMNKYVFRICKQCVFFGNIQEVQRVFTGGSMMWCLFIMSACLVSFTTGAIVLIGVIRKIKYTNVKSSFFNQSRYVIILRVSILWTFLAGLVAARGLMVWCSSFKINSCLNNNDQDWHGFTPKHSDCFGATVWQILLNVFLWGSVLLQSYDYSQSIK